MSKIDDVLPLPERANVLCLTDNVLVMKHVVPEWRNELIQIAEKINHWKQSGQVEHGSLNGGVYSSEYRTSNSLMISVRNSLYGPCLRRFEEALIKVFHSAALAYCAYNPHLKITDDSGYELLRYQEGQHFGLHTDAILGRNEGFRQLSGLIFLNDNYEGGETSFPRQGFKFKGEAGDVLLFPSNFCYPHESLPVTCGTKYAIVTWFVAYPKRPEEEGSQDEAQDAGGGAEPVADDGVRLHRSTGSGSPEGEPEASDREHSTCVGRSTGQGHEA